MALNLSSIRGISINSDIVQPLARFGVAIALVGGSLFGAYHITASDMVKKLESQPTAAPLASASQPANIATTVPGAKGVVVPPALEAGAKTLLTQAGRLLPDFARRAPYESYIRQAARQNNLDPNLLRAVISAESAYNPKAVSHVGAIGLMQLMPKTARRFGINNVHNPEQNIVAGARYLGFLMHHFGDLKLAIAAYNAGEGAVAKYGNHIPPYPETMSYVPKVMDYYNTYRNQG